ncbi:hypothetical protein SD71_09670 [Cohnella kolymensis]|uniref:Copper amine oxidase-like N-terminal domain-containing protein n=1 Tax=Cohnella kolymensis TaxID=1590652 RepID=A0ABR5A596_9BACL|nr:stalk domain-containing protein [Cohnella kolymensis]KIL36206.1 hypothetical protein SD71_09670 [Cohnella kolymensis]
MKLRRLIVLTLALTLLCGTAAYAESITQRLNIWVNKQAMEDAGVVVDDKTYLSVRAIADKLNVIVTWDEDSKRVSIFKPNVHMLTMQDTVPFGGVTKDKYKFFVFTQIDSLKTDISAFKVTITDPYGDDTWLDGRNSNDKDFPDRGKDNFSFKTKEISYDFKYSGKYVVRFWMKPQGDTAFQVVSEKVITSK